MNKYYTVEQISELLSMHPKTIQRYIREGKLPANKIGKSWRISGHDLSVFAESNNISDIDIAATSENKVLISSVIDINVLTSEESIRIMNSLTAVLNCKKQEYGKSTMYVQYLEYENKVRVTLWGTLLFMQEMIDFISVITGQTK